MNEISLQHPMDYRKEIAATFFHRMQAAESCAIVGAASMGKTHLQDFLTHPSVLERYLGTQWEDTLFLRVDCNRLAQVSEWGLYELLLSSLVEGSFDHPKAKQRHPTLNDLRQAVILKPDPLLALRHLELAVHVVTKIIGLKLCFLIDEFDDLYRSLPAIALAHLRGLRDANKSRFCYTLFLRNTPEYVRDPADCESFYELFSHFVLGLRPYVSRDAEEMVGILQERRHRNIPSQVQASLLRWSGGHPGMIMTLFRLAVDNPQWFQDETGMNALIEEPIMGEECKKLWHSLPAEEQEGFARLLHAEKISDNVRRRLELKGLIDSGGPSRGATIPILALYVIKMGLKSAGK